MRILVADDDKTSRELLRAQLEKQGHEVLTAVDGEEAWDRLQETDAPRLLIIDWLMPQMSGPELCNKIKAHYLDNPPYLILLTVQNEQEKLAEGLDSGADDYMVKPFRPLELRARVDVGLRIIKLRDRLARMASFDELTGAWNRRSGLDALPRELARALRHNQPLGVGLIDIDHFKRVNDNHGHLVGDDVLRGLVNRLSSSLRRYDLLCRYGGEEFLVLSPGATEKTPWDRILEAVAREPFETRSGPISVTVSIGSTISSGDNDPETVISVSDIALYRAKELGRNRSEHEALSHSKHASTAQSPDANELSSRGSDLSRSSSSNAVHRSRDRILIAEDDLTSRTLLKAILEKHGYEVIATSDGKEAWERLQNPDAPRLLIIDRMMPNMNGLELCRRIRAQEQERPPYLIILTALGETSNIVEGLDAGADDYMIKPFDPIELRARVDAGERVLALRDSLVSQAEDLREAMAQIKTLSGLVPICMHCKRVRDDKNFWFEVEEYVANHTNAFFSHGLCPDCLEKHYTTDDDDEP